MLNVKANEDNARLFVCGDVVIYDEGKNEIASSELKKIIRDADYSICNFEGPISEELIPIKKIGPSVQIFDKAVEMLKDIGFDLFLLANNHITDFGKEGIKTTIAESNKYGIDTIGAGTSFDEAYEPIIKEINGLKIGMINACEAQIGVMDYTADNGDFGYAWINHKKIDEIITELRDKCDYLIFFAHAGLEHTNIPLKEWRYRYQQLIDLGVDVVLGSHPHVPQGYELYKNKPIFYSLGNFYTNHRRISMKEFRSYSVILDLGKSGNIGFDFVYHQIDNDFVSISPKDNKIDMSELNEYLNNGYQDHYDDLCMKVYNKHLLYHYFRSYCVLLYRGSIKSTIEFHYNSLVSIFSKRKRPEKNLLRLHLIRNESYRFASQRALYLMSMKGRKYS